MMRAVDDHRRRTVDIEGDVVDDADDLVIARGDEMLADDGVEWQAGKCGACEIRAHHHTARRPRIVPLVGRPRAGLSPFRLSAQ